MVGIRTLFVVAGAALIGACVTINVYFPAAAAEQAADRIIEKVWGEDAERAPAGAGPSSALPAPRTLARALLDWLVPPARAQGADFDVSTPAIEKIQASMRERHARLAPLYDRGAVGLTDDGRVALRDANAVPLAERGSVNALVAEENRDRDALYREIARANGHPEWEGEIRSTFARRWIERAGSGWWYQSGGTWQRK